MLPKNTIRLTPFIRSFRLAPTCAEAQGPPSPAQSIPTPATTPVPPTSATSVPNASAVSSPPPKPVDQTNERDEKEKRGEDVKGPDFGKKHAAASSSPSLGTQRTKPTKEPLKSTASKLIDDQDDYGYAFPPDRNPMDPEGAMEARRRLRLIIGVLGAGAAIGAYKIWETKDEMARSAKHA